MTSFSWWTVIPSAIGGLIGGSFAVTGMIVAGRRERAKDRERRTEEAVRSVQQCLLAVADLYGSATSADDPGSLTSSGYYFRERLVSQLRMHTSSIPDQKIRQPLEAVDRLLNYPGPEGLRESYSDAYVTRHICRYGMEVATGYLQGSAPPETPDLIKPYLAGDANRG